jgi:hypothetical protein
MARRSSKSFSAAVEDWARQTEQRAKEVFRQSATLIAEEVARPVDQGGSLPVLTGRLRRSLAASTAAMPSVQWRAKEFPDNSGQIVATIAAAEIGQTIYLGFQAPYAQKAERAHGFVRLAGQRWQQIVQEAARIAKGKTT